MTATTIVAPTPKEFEDGTQEIQQLVIARHVLNGDES